MPKKLQTLVEQCGRGALVSTSNIDQLTTDKGAYLVIIAISETFQLEIATLPRANIEAGYYVYCGSARGPGGIRARLKRHFARDKRRHWHVDHLTLQALELRAIAIPGGDECQLNAELMDTGRFTTPVTGFGASDCNTCPSHLLLWQDR